MKYFLYDEENKRMVLVDEVYPTLNHDGRFDGGAEGVITRLTNSSKMERLYNSLYIWEDVTIRFGRDNLIIQNVKEEGDKEKDTYKKIFKTILSIPYTDHYLIQSGSYVYKKPKE